jgi:hypothetical protein
MWSDIGRRLRLCLPEISPHGFLGFLQQYLPFVPSGALEPNDASIIW